MRNFLSGKVAIIGVSVATILIVALILIPGISAEETSGLAILLAEIEDCTFVDPTGGPLITVAADKIILIEDKKEDGFHLFKCEADNFPYPPSSTIVIDGPSIYGECNVTVDTVVDNTRNWTQVINPNGRASLTCRFNPSTFAQ